MQSPVTYILVPSHRKVYFANCPRFCAVLPRMRVVSTVPLKFNTSRRRSLRGLLETVSVRLTRRYGRTPEVHLGFHVWRLAHGKLCVTVNIANCSQDRALDHCIRDSLDIAPRVWRGTCHLEPEGILLSHLLMALAPW